MEIVEAHHEIFAYRGCRYYDVPVGAPYFARCQHTTVQRGLVHICEFVDGHSQPCESVNTWLTKRQFNRLMAFNRLPLRKQCVIWKKIEDAPVNQKALVMLEEFAAAEAAEQT